MGSKLPFQSFPGIFSSIDSYTKKVIEGEHAGCGRLPVYLSEMLPPYDSLTLQPPPHWSKYSRLDPATGITLRGTPDIMFLYVRESESVNKAVIADYKTARLTDKATELEAVYRVQLNSYSWIGEEKWFPADELFLIYYEPQTEIGDREGCVPLSEASSKGGMCLKFRPKWKQVPVDHDEVRTLLAKARCYFDKATPPDGRTGCKECANVNALIELLGTTAATAPF